jgi:hypothetical protein
VPDDQDYAGLGRLLSSPATWSAQDATYMKSLLVRQADAVAGCHPKDSKGRQRLQALVDDIQAALEKYEARRE